MFAEFHFLRPWWLLAALPLIAFLFWFARRRFAMRRWQDIVEPQLMPHVLIGADYRKRRRVTVWLVLAGALLILALSGPVWQRIAQPVFRSQDALVIALDLSRSMDVADIAPSRLVRARFKINDILNRRVEGQSALIVYAADPYVVSPLTDDTRTIVAQLPALETGLMPSQGSRADRALVKAAELLKQAGVTDGHVVLVTDGVFGDETATAAAELLAAGIRTSVLGVGTAEGGPIPGSGGFVKRRDGSIVIATLDASALADVAARGGGVYRQLAPDESDIDRLLDGVEALGTETTDTDLTADVWREEGPWLLLPLLPLVALAFRRGVLAVALLVFILPPRPADAFDWADLWSRPDQRAGRMLDAGDTAAAARTFEDPAWRSAAAYRAELYADSLAASDGLEDIESAYNRGNALARLERYDEALAEYDNVLERDPKHNDARYNRDLIRQQQQQQDQQGEDEEQQQQQDQQGQGGEQPQQAGNESAQAEQARRDAAQSGQDSKDPSGERQAEEEVGQPDDTAAAGDAPRSEGEKEDEREDDSEGEPGDARLAAETGMPDEEAQKMEQWLRKIPDDPAGLLRRKFYYQYQQRDSGRQEDEQW